MRKYLFCVCLVLAITVLLPHQMAYACQGAGDFKVNDLPDMDLIVRASVVAVDDRGYNAVLEVHEYFKGSGVKYLAVVRYPAALQIAYVKRRYSNGCGYGGGGLELTKGSTGYFALLNNGDGTYQDMNYASQTAHFFSHDGLIEFYHLSKTGSFETLHLPDVEFEVMLLKVAGETAPRQPDYRQGNPYPLWRFLHITTESGQRYRLNPDRSVTLQGDEAPLATSPDGTHVAFRLDDERVGFHIFGYRYTRNEKFSSLLLQRGQEVLFSPDSNLAAVWDTSHLTINMFDNHETRIYGQRIGMQEVAETPLVGASDAVRVKWSADSSVISFEDDQGIWLWDIFKQPVPQLIHSSEQLAGSHLLDISLSGRYVRYGNEATWTLLDRLTGETFQNAIVTPDENNFIYIVSTYPAGVDATNPQGNRVCTPPLAETCPIYVQAYGRTIAFNSGDNLIGVLSCYGLACKITNFSWVLSYRASFWEEFVIRLPKVNAFAYDIWYRQPALAIGDYRIEFGYYPETYDRTVPNNIFEYIDVIDLSEMLDSPIAKLEWGQPIFFEERMYYIR